MTVPMRTDVIKFDEFDPIQENLFPLCVLLMYIIPIHRLIMRIVSERESRAREIMKVMGMKESSYWISWFIYYISITTVIAFASWGITKYNVLPNSNGLLIFGYFWLYGLSVFGYTIMMSAFFSSPRIASLVSNMVYFFTHFCDYAVSSPYASSTQKFLASLLPSIAMKRSLYNILRFEKASVGLQFSNMNEEYYNYKVESAYYLYFVAFVVCFLLGVYLSNVLRLSKDDLDESIKLPWYYPFSLNYWRGTAKKTVKSR